MNLGIYLDGTKNSILTNLDKVAKKEEERFDLQCREYQYLNGWDHSNPVHPLPIHVKRLIKNEFTGDIINLVSAHFKEQLEDLADDEPCSVAFQITIHRRNHK